MPHSARRFRRSLLVLGALLALSGATLAPAHVSTARAAFGVAATPSALALSLPLGQAITAPIALSNSSGKALPIALYEAYPDAQPALALQAAPTAEMVALPRQPERVDPRLLAELQA